jgi:hypothetical protein
MISDRNRGIQNLVLVCQCVLVTVAFWLWLVLCYYQPIDHQVITRYIVYNEFVLLGLLMGSRPFRPEVGLHTRGFEEVNRRSFRQLGATLFYLLLYIVAARDEKISRLFLFSFIPLLYLVLFTTNRYLPGLLGHLTFRRGQLQKVLLLGPKHKALGVKHWLEENKHLGLEVLGLLTEEASAGMHQAPQTIPNGTTNRESGNSRTQTFTVVASGTIPSMKSARWAKAEGEEATSFGGVPLSASPAVPAARNGAASSARSATPVADALRILGRPEDLEKVLAAPGIMKVIMVEFPRANGTMRYYTNLCEARGIRLLVVADIDQIFGHPVAGGAVAEPDQPVFQTLPGYRYQPAGGSLHPAAFDAGVPDHPKISIPGPALLHTASGRHPKTFLSGLQVSLDAHERPGKRETTNLKERSQAVSTGHLHAQDQPR